MFLCNICLACEIDISLTIALSRSIPTCYLNFDITNASFRLVHQHPENITSDLDVTLYIGLFLAGFVVLPKAHL
jgi:hypothetical protein